MQKRGRSEQPTEIERMVRRAGSFAKWAVILMVMGIGGQIALVVYVVLRADDRQGEWFYAQLVLLESSFLIYLLAPLFAFGALCVASKAVKVASKSQGLSVAVHILHRSVIYLCAAGTILAIEGGIGTVFVQKTGTSRALFWEDKAWVFLMNGWMGILVAVGLCLAVASCRLTRTFAAPTKLPRRTIIFIGILTVLWLAVASHSTILCLAKRIQSPAITGGFDLPTADRAFDCQSSEMEGTIIVPTLNTATGFGKNVIWCSSFQLAWNEMRDFVGGEPLQIVGAEDLATRLNNAPQSSADLEKESYFVAADLVRNGILERIDSELQSRFSTAPPQEFELDRLDPSDVLAYAYLTANVPFDVPFREYKHEFIFEDSRGEKTPVKSFGVWEAYEPQYKKMAEQIRILYAKGSDPNHPFRDLAEFALDLSKDTEPYQIVLAIIEPGPTLADTLEALNRKIADYPIGNSQLQYTHDFHSSDRLVVPEMFWRIAHRFKELEGKLLVSDKVIGPVRLAAQVTEFKLDKSGAILESHAAIAAPSRPRCFYFNKPFILYMKKRDREDPFFVMWVDNAELLSKF